MAFFQVANADSAYHAYGDSTWTEYSPELQKVTNAYGGIHSQARIDFNFRFALIVADFLGRHSSMSAVSGGSATDFEKLPSEARRAQTVQQEVNGVVGVEEEVEAGPDQSVRSPVISIYWHQYNIEHRHRARRQQENNANR